ncbi:MAG: cytochrome c oxidase subunit II [Micavibrio aeruginosavorus]|uniref:Cytochrome c oxidase subunit 2 n=1 Tax=Micavibrio aeruginosavorus TaxID=349221 RepID=A0A2W5A3S3_9BACT|nr:MAG: cytochrome c oxidase subunit II [Micavibrio aeruginosavorus]
MTKLASRLLASLIATILVSFPALAFEPKPTDLGLQAPASPNMERLHHFHDNILLIVISVIVVFVFLLLGWVALRYNAKANPVPSKTTHHVMLEVVWTIIPVIILLLIAIPSYKLLFYLARTPAPVEGEANMTLKVSGYQWGWTYTYPDADNLEFNADMIADNEIDQYIPDGKGRRMLETYNPIVLPTEQNIQILTTATDVIHSWTVPAFGVKKDAVPGRTNETWVRITQPGIYYGQCSEICGIRHASMPIAVYAVPTEDYNAWIACMKGDGAESKADFPSRACVQSLDFDAKYRGAQNAKTAVNQ